jgi:hypothetical protein
MQVCDKVFGERMFHIQAFSKGIQYGFRYHRVFWRQRIIAVGLVQFAGILEIALHGEFYFGVIRNVRKIDFRNFLLGTGIEDR